MEAARVAAGKFTKFLERLGKPISGVSKDETEKRRGNRKPAHLKHPRSKNLDQCGPDGRVLPEFRKYKDRVGRRHYAAKRATLKRRRKRHYAKRRAKQAAWRATLHRKYIVCRSKHRGYALKRGLNPDLYFPLTLAEFMILWKEKKWVEGKFVELHTIKGLWMARRDLFKPFTRDNLVILEKNSVSITQDRGNYLRSLRS